MRKVLKIAGALAAAGVFVAALAAHEEGHAQDGLAVGVQGAFTNWDSDDEEESGVGGGLVVRYTAPIGDGMFAGLQASWSFTEGAEWEGSLSDALVSVSGTAEIDWSADLLARVGTSIGDADAYVAAGLAFARAKTTLNVAIADRAGSASSSGSYSGFKLAAGVDLPVSETMEAFVQLEYADYGDATYFGLFDLDLTALAMRAGLLYRF